MGLTLLLLAVGVMFAPAIYRLAFRNWREKTWGERLTGVIVVAVWLGLLFLMGEYAGEPSYDPMERGYR